MKKTTSPITELLAIITVVLVFLIFMIAFRHWKDSDELTSESSKVISDEQSEAVSKEPSEEPFEDPSEESSEEPSEEPSEDPSEDPSEESSEKTSEEPSEDPSEESSEEASEEPSEEPSEDPSEESSEEPSEEPSEYPSEESSEEISEEISLEIYQEIMQEFPQHNIAYALYDIKTGETIAEYNTNTLFRTGCTIKPIYVFYLLSEKEVNLKDKITLSRSHIDKEGFSHILNNLGKTYNYGDSFTIKTLIEFTITYSDNVAYKMLTTTYGYNGFNKFMEEQGIKIGLGNQAIGSGSNYTSATAKNQLKVWIAINNYLSTNSSNSKYFGERLKTKSGVKFAEYAINHTTFSMAGWAEKTTTFNECYIVDGKYIAIILTSTGKTTPTGEDIDTRPLEKTAVLLHEAWEAYQKNS